MYSCSGAFSLLLILAIVFNAETAAPKKPAAKGAAAPANAKGAAPAPAAAPAGAPTTRHALTSDDVKQGAKLGFHCHRVQSPIFRSRKHKPKIVFESLTIIKHTKISISSEIEFTLLCKRDPKRDQGDVRSEEEAEAEAPVEEGTTIEPEPVPEGAEVDDEWKSGGDEATTEGEGEASSEGGEEAATAPNEPAEGGEAGAAPAPEAGAAAAGPAAAPAPEAEA